MNKQDVIGFIDKIRVAYPNRKYYETKDDLSKLIDLWLEMYGFYSQKFMNRVVMRSLSKSEFPPTFATISASAEEIRKELRTEIYETQHSVTHWGDCLKYCKDEERAEFEKYKQEAEEHLKELENFEVYD